MSAEVIGRSVQGRPISLARVGDPAAPRKVLAVGCIHGNEPAGRDIVADLMRAAPRPDTQLLIVRDMNPDGFAHHERTNAHGVDLNRNYPYHWVDLDGNYESGAHPGSEPETRAMMRFLSRIQPDYVLSFHQPLNGVDTDNKRPGFSRRVAHSLRLPATTLDCGGVCHGTMTGWYNHNFDGFALTVEYGAHPPKRLMQTIAPRQVLRIFGGFGSFGGR